MKAVSIIQTTLHPLFTLTKKKLASCSDDGTVRIWNFKRPTLADEAQRIIDEEAGGGEFAQLRSKTELSQLPLIVSLESTSLHAPIISDGNNNNLSASTDASGNAPPHPGGNEGGSGKYQNFLKIQPFL